MGEGTDIAIVQPDPYLRERPDASRDRPDVERLLREGVGPARGSDPAWERQSRVAEAQVRPACPFLEVEDLREARHTVGSLPAPCLFARKGELYAKIVSGLGATPGYRVVRFRDMAEFLLPADAEATQVMARVTFEELPR